MKHPGNMFSQFPWLRWQCTLQGIILLEINISQVYSSTLQFRMKKRIQHLNVLAPSRPILKSSSVLRLQTHHLEQKTWCGNMRCCTIHCSNVTEWLVPDLPTTTKGCVLANIFLPQVTCISKKKQKKTKKKKKKRYEL